MTQSTEFFYQQDFFYGDAVIPTVDEDTLIDKNVLQKGYSLVVSQDNARTF